MSGFSSKNPRPLEGVVKAFMIIRTGVAMPLR